MNWLHLIENIALIGGAIFGLIWAWRNDYISWSNIKGSFRTDGLKDMVYVIFSDPTFIFLYLIFVLAPVWVLTEWLKLYTIPLYQKILLSLGGIFAVNQVMIAKGLK